jgi:Carboxypeptidase regulatory-like domain
MRPIQVISRTLALSIFFAGALSQAATVIGTVTNKTTGKPAAGDQVVLVDVQAGMGEVAHATTDVNGRYSLNEPGSGPYLIRATHQGAGYFVAAPEGPSPANITVYDVSAKVQGVFIEADVLEIESSNGQLKVTERFFVHNTSSPPVTQWSTRSFEIVLPADAVVDGVGGQRPNGLPTSIKIDPDGPKGHYAFNFPIQPDDGEKDTLFQLAYHLPYSGEKYTFHSQVTLPADNFAVLVPKSMTFTPTSGEAFKTVPEDANVQTFVLKNATPEKPVDFTIAGNGAIPREQQGAPGAQSQGAAMGAPDAAAGADAAANGNGGSPGGGIGNPIDTPDPLSKYKWWILGGLALLLAAAAAFLLRKPPGSQAPGSAADAGSIAHPSLGPVVFNSPAAKHNQLLNALKEELFSVESEKINGSITAEDYAQVKAALETVLKRALNRK